MISVQTQTQVIVTTPETQPLQQARSWRPNLDHWEPSMFSELVALLSRVRNIEDRLAELKKEKRWA